MIYPWRESLTTLWRMIAIIKYISKYETALKIHHCNFYFSFCIHITAFSYFSFWKYINSFFIFILKKTLLHFFNFSFENTLLLSFFHFFENTFLYFFISVFENTLRHFFISLFDNIFLSEHVENFLWKQNIYFFQLIFL